MFSSTRQVLSGRQLNSRTGYAFDAEAVLAAAAQAGTADELHGQPDRQDDDDMCRAWPA